MASKFQNRLVGTIVLVALGVIVLPGLLDGQKKHYQDEFAAIPLVPKPGDRDEPDMLPTATQALPAQPPEGAAEEVRAGGCCGTFTGLQPTGSQWQWRSGTDPTCCGATKTEAGRKAEA
ncbi:cell division protein DedD [Kluyvera intermedia]|nr:cell division protein DedD [Kluyvera intermedia]